MNVLSICFKINNHKTKTGGNRKSFIERTRWNHCQKTHLFFYGNIFFELINKIIWAILQIMHFSIYSNNYAATAVISCVRECSVCDTEEMEGGHRHTWISATKLCDLSAFLVFHLFPVTTAQDKSFKFSHPYHRCVSERWPHCVKRQPCVKWGAPQSRLYLRCCFVRTSAPSPGCELCPRRGQMLNLWARTPPGPKPKHPPHPRPGIRTRSLRSFALSKRPHLRPRSSWSC